MSARLVRFHAARPLSASPLGRALQPARCFSTTPVRADGRDQVKAKIGDKHVHEQAQRQSNLGHPNKTSSRKAADGPPADETIETGGPFSQGERQADKQTRHGSSHNTDERQQRRAERADHEARESRAQGGYSQMRPWLAGLNSMLRPQPTTSTWSLASPLVLSRSMSSTAKACFPTPAPTMTEESNSMKMRGQNADGSSPQSGHGPSTNDEPSARSKTRHGVDPSYERASGMPSSVSEEATPSHNAAQQDERFDSIQARKQPQKDKSTLASIRDAFTPSPSASGSGPGAAGGGSGWSVGEGGVGTEAEPECYKAVRGGAGMLRSVKDSVKKVVSGDK